MLVLARKIQESVVVGGASQVEQLVKVTVIDIRGGTVRLGFEANTSVPVHRAEVWERICAETQAPDATRVVQRPKQRVPYCD